MQRLTYSLPRVLTKPKHVKDVFRDSDKHSKAMDNNSGYLMNQLLGQCVGLISGRSWKTLRAAVEGPFLQSSSKYQLPMIINRTRGYLDGLATTSNLDQGLLHPVRDLKMLPFWIIADMLYGTLSDQMETELREMAPRREELFKYVIKGGATRFHWTQILPSKANRELKRFNTEWRVFNKKAYERARAEGAKAPIFDMFENVKCGRVSEEQILQTLDEILFANLDVTMGGLSWNLVFLAANSRVQQKLLDEILKGTGPGTGEDPAGTNSYLLSSSTFLSACILESARLRPLAAFSVPQSAPSRRVIEGFDIPSGVNFVVDAYSLNTNVDFWGSDSLVYRPERFIEQKNTDFRYNYWRYGFGPRQCLGKHVADLVIRSLLVLFLPTHKLSLRHDSSDWQRLEEVWINHPDMELECRRRS